MNPKQKLNLSKYDSSQVAEMDDLTLRNIIYQVYGEWNSEFTRQDLEDIGQDALSDIRGYEDEAKADRALNDLVYGNDD